MAKWFTENSGSIFDEQKRIKRRINKLYRRINRLKTRHNQLASTNRLPPKLLVHIFFHLQSNFYEDSPEDYYKWTAVTHVSRSWRTIALETKPLWSGISQATESRTPSFWTSLSIERSEPLEIDIVLKVRDGTTSILPLDQDHAPRMRTVHVEVAGRGYVLDWRLNHILDWFRGLEMPNLEEFTLQGERDAELRSTVNIVIGSLFNSIAPRLRILKLSYVNLNIQHIRFQGLTMLKIMYSSFTFHTIFEVLRTTRLESLELLYALVDDAASEADDAEPIALPHLQRLVLQLPPQQCLKILRNIILSPSCRSTIWGCGSNYSNPEPQLATPPTFFDAVLPYLSSDPTEFIGMTMNMKESLVLCGLYREISWKGTFWDVEECSKIGFFSLEKKIDCLPLVSAFSNVWSVELQGSVCTALRSAITDLVQTLSALPWLRELYVDSPLVIPVADQIYANPSSFGSLDNLIITLANNLPHPYHTLERALSKRQDLNGELLTLRLIGTKGWEEEEPFREALNGLRDVVGSLSFS